MTNTLVDRLHDTISQRQSVGHLVAPAPNQQQLALAFEAALAAPDHHRLKPTRFVIIPSEKRAAFGELLSNSLASTEMDPVQIDRVKNHPFRAPLLVLALTTLQDHAKVPHYEQILSSGAVIENFLLSLQAQGFASIWRTGAVSESNALKHALGLQHRDLIAGIIYIGTADKHMPARQKINIDEFVSTWSDA
ncbi:nitroreductase family protein [Acinetobacter sp. MD2(2019)]|uniref:nitroreductase family protein n=1 Tax=Acinetobacter sp. MD2(2019) TaxID=2605273 RepID=UPI002D1F139B|nr:nitroreductase family protein [Acinetobacter sp. MD2(2019)]MEB3752788.1 nitroreductase family protein [Acinetobacter sp. MD2(2019)]